MLLSFIIPAHNEEALIGATIDALHATAGPLGRPYEVIVAADACTDGTAEAARQHGAVVVAHERRQISATRNLGATAARGDYLFFVDADTHVTAGALTQALAALDAGAIGGGSPIRFDRPIPLLARIMVPIFMKGLHLKGIAGGAFFFCRAEALRKAGGWDETVFAGEELYLSKALRQQGRFVIVKEAVVTSGRKLSTHSSWEQLWTMIRIGFWRPTLRKREALGLWYVRRDDPHPPSPTPASTPAAKSAHHGK